MLKENTQVLPKERAALKILPEQYSIETEVTIWETRISKFHSPRYNLCSIISMYIHKNSAIAAVSKVLYYSVNVELG